MKLLLLLSFLFCLPAEANVFPIFNRDGNMATLMLTGTGQDVDAYNLYNALGVPRQDEQGKWTKKVALVDQAGVKTFSAVCVFSKVVETSGSCTLVLRSSNGLLINLNDKTASYDLLGGPDLENFAKLFLIPGESGDFYRSANNRLVIGTEHDGNGILRRIYLHYR
jgi:hypothetical protein